MRPSRPLLALAGAGIAAAVAVAVLPVLGPEPQALAACPPGSARYGGTAAERAAEARQLQDAARQGGAAAAVAQRAEKQSEALEARVALAGGCRPSRLPESSAELTAMTAQRSVLSAGPLGYTPPGALRQAVAGRAAATAAVQDVRAAQGSFAPIGTTPLIADDPAYPSVNGLGLADQAGRVDSYAYDAGNRRLFSAPGTGGVWMSTDSGASWRSVGDALPYQSVGAVEWSSAGNAANGTLLVLSGEASAGGNVYTGIGAFWSTDLGATWQQATGIPDGLMGFEIAVDPTNAATVYAATSQGLYRSTDAGRSYVNVVLPTGDCAGKTGYDNVCQNANWVTDVEIREPGGIGADKSGGQVLAVVGYRAGRLPYPGTSTPQSPANGLYRSDTGEAGTFTMLDVSGDGQTPQGFAPQERIGRTEFGAARGPLQDHGYVYAIVQDAVLFNGGVPGIDAFDDTTVTGGAVNNTALNGIYVSPDFGSSWTRMADEVELQNPLTESALIGASAASLYQPGIQAWYNQFIEPDPTTATASGVPTRLVFGLEELWESRLSGTPQDGTTQAAEPVSFRVIGPYFSDDTCGFLDNPLPVCPTQQTTSGQTTTHPDQQAGIWVPQDDGGVTLVVGNDGGTFRQSVAKGGQLSKAAWGRGSQTGYGANTLLPYDANAAKDGTVVFGLQDNGSGKVEPQGRVVETFGGDGFYAAVDPDNSDVYYNETTLADMRVTTDGGRTYTTIPPPVTAPLFANPFLMDPTDANHLITGGPEVVERLQGPTGDWVQVFTTGAGTQVSSVELQAENAYVGFCSVCDIVNKDPKAGQVFSSGLATNVAGAAPPKKGSPDGWHIAEAKGLPDRYITGIAADPADPKTVYVTLAGYANRQWWPAGSFNDANPNLGEGSVYKSTDAGETFTNISGDLPDVPARSIELRGSTLVVGTDVGLFVSEGASGGTWAAPVGLPNVPVVSVRNNPGRLDQVVLATFGRGMYTYTFPTDQTPAARSIVQACPPDRVPRNSRNDDDGNVHEAAIDCMVWWEIAKGTSATKYEPTVPVSRGQMASFIARLVEAGGGKLPANAPDAFTDDQGGEHEANTDKLAAAGIVRGTAGGDYRPTDPVSRAQMATFLVRAYEYRSGKSIVVPGDYFDDDNGTVHEANINKAAAAGFTAGRNGGYEPTQPVLRDAMASFLARTLALLVEEGTTPAK